MLRRANRAIAKIAGRVEEEAIARAELKSLRCRDLLSCDLTAYLVEEVVQFFPWYLGLHPAGIPRVQLPRRLFISTLREGEREERRTRARFPSFLRNVTSPVLSPSLLFLQVTPQRRVALSWTHK